jgi:hypothetical protein
MGVRTFTSTKGEPTMAQYAVLMYAPVPNADEVPNPEDRELHHRYADELRKSGAMVLAYALEPAAMATSLRGDIVTDGPFIETKEVVVGFYVLDVPHLDAALELVRRNPILQQGGGVEVRPVEGGSIEVRH